MNKLYRKSRIIENYSLLIIDVLCVIGSYLLALLLRFGTVKIDFAIQEHYFVCAGLVVSCLLYNGFVDWNRDFFERGNLVELICVFKYIVVTTVAMGCLIFFAKIANDYSRLTFGYYAVTNGTLTYIAHLIFRYLMLNHYRKSRSSDKVMIITESRWASKVTHRVITEKAWNYEITSLAVLDKDMVGESVLDIPVVAGLENLYEVARQMMLDEVFIYLPDMDKEVVKNLIIDMETMGVICHYNVEVPELDLVGKTAGNFAGYAVMTFSLQNMDYRRLLVKRVMDIFGGIIGCLITLILTPFVALAIKLDSKGPVFFSQIRIGKNGRRFKIFKFRSMYVDAEEQKKKLETQNEVKGLMFKMTDDPRVTKVGKIIRKLSIDELPQFFNIVRGDMSLVGTRPPTVEEFEQYSIAYRRRLCITPGLTGMWQVSGRSDIVDFEEVVKLDLAYIDNWSLSLDIKILAKTIGIVLFGKGAK